MAAMVSVSGSPTDSWLSAAVTLTFPGPCGAVQFRLWLIKVSMSLNDSRQEPQMNVSSGILEVLET